MALGQTAGCPRVNRAKKFMCLPRNTGNINFSLWLTGGLSQGCPDFQKVCVFKVYVPFLALTDANIQDENCIADLRWPDSRKSIRKFARIAWFTQIVSGLLNWTPVFKSHFGGLKNGESQVWGDSRKSLARYEKRFFFCESIRANWFVRIALIRAANCLSKSPIVNFLENPNVLK